MEEGNRYHAHAVMEMMVASGARYDRASLVRAIEAQFGRGARFHACSGGGMDAEELIGFLEGKGKFIGTPESFTFDPGRVCKGH